MAIVSTDRRILLQLYAEIISSGFLGGDTEETNVSRIQRHNSLVSEPYCNYSCIALDLQKLEAAVEESEPCMGGLDAGTSADAASSLRESHGR